MARSRSIATLVLLAQLGPQYAALGQPGVNYRANLDKSTVRFKATTDNPLLREVRASIKRFEFNGRLDSGSVVDQTLRLEPPQSRVDRAVDGP